MTEEPLQRALLRRLEDKHDTRIPELRRALWREMPREVFDRLLLDLERDGSVLLTPHARSEGLTLSEREDGIRSARGLLYLARLLRAQ